MLEKLQHTVTQAGIYDETQQDQNLICNIQNYQLIDDCKIEFYRIGRINIFKFYGSLFMES